MSLPDKQRGAPGLIPLARNAWRIGNVMLSRRLGRPPGYLPVLLMFVSWRCNLRCRMCGVCESTRTPEAFQGELNTDQWRSVLDSAATRLGTSLISISGGEPLLRKDIYDLIRHGADMGISVHICTNAVLLGVREAEQLRDAGVSTVSISLESPDAALHDYLRGDNTHEAVVRAIRLLRETAPNVRIGINYLITRRNYKDMPRMVAFAESLGVHQIKFAPIHTNLLHRHKAMEQYGDLLFTPEDLDNLKQEMEGLRRACATSRLATTSDAFIAGIHRLYSDPEPFQCYAGYALCAVSPSGQVAPCCDMDRSFSVLERPLHEIWRDPAFHELRRRVHHCEATCWDTTNTELSLRLRPISMASDLFRNWRDLRFYLGDKRQ